MKVPPRYWVLACTQFCSKITGPQCVHWKLQGVHSTEAASSRGVSAWPADTQKGLMREVQQNFQYA